LTINGMVGKQLFPSPCGSQVHQRRPARAAAVVFLAATTLVALVAALPALRPIGFVSVQGTLSRGNAVALRAKNSIYYSNADVERLKNRRKESRQELRDWESRGLMGPKIVPAEYDKLPSIDDLYNRTFSGNAAKDPIGGRKRYTYLVLFKLDPTSKGPEKLKALLVDYVRFFKTKMSCKDIKIKKKKSPIDGANVVTLEYPMKEYGPMARGQSVKQKQEKAIMFEIKITAPVQAGEYIAKKFYNDHMMLRFMVLGHTRRFGHANEDNELFL